MDIYPSMAIFVFSIAGLLIWCWFLRERIQELESNIRTMLRNEFGRRELVIKRSYSTSEDSNPEIVINKESYLRGDTIKDPPYSDCYGNLDSPFYISEIIRPKAGSTIWKVKIVDKETRGRLFDTILTHDHMNDNYEDEDDEFDEDNDEIDELDNDDEL